MPTFSLCYTSARPAEIERVLGEWEARSGLSPADYLQEVEVVVTMDRGNEQFMADLKTRYPQLVTAINPGNKDCVTGWNLAGSLAGGQVLITLSDDFLPPVDWYRQLLDLPPAGWIHKEVVVAVSDGCNPDILTISILTRKRYQRFGYIFYSLYQSLFCDTEFSAVAMADEVILDARHLLFEHRHFSAGKRSQDVIDQTHSGSGRWKRGEALFQMRQSCGFPIDAGPVADARRESHLKFGVVVQAIRDDFCLAEVCRRLLDEPTDGTYSIDSLIIFQPDRYWSGEPATERDKAEIEAAYRSIVASRPPGEKIVKVVPFEIEKVTHFNQPRIRVETACRNWYQWVMAKQGIDHCIIVDGDELWEPGLLARLAEYVRDNGPNSVYTGMIPVAGLPGYPIEGALDKATVYARSDVSFKECRGAFGYRHELPGFPILHFSATRRTMQEIVDKHMNSGHADDPEYPMAVWCRDVLPNIRPGMREAHMHIRKPNIWPLVRKWAPAEWTSLPESVKPYLGAPS